jgi:predicted AAA+ superfamily ATPase|tara:strand:- start:772 stop:924 length:153 start_codon:yes stop_codon:yes gene_type:complete
VEFRFPKKHLSAGKFNKFLTPDLLVLTGINFAGKSHFLEEIPKNKVEITG